MSLFTSYLRMVANNDASKFVNRVVETGGDGLVGKILHSRATLQSSDLSGQTFNSVLNELKHAGVNKVKIIPTNSGGYVVKADDIRRTGVCGLFPGGVMTPNGGKINRVSFKFNNAGDCVQLTGIQKTANAVAGSTIRTTQGIQDLQKAGVLNPSEYVQVYSSGNKRWINKTFSPFGDKPIPVDTVKNTEAVHKTVANTAKSAEKAKAEAEELLFNSTREIETTLNSVNPELAEKVSNRIYQIAEKDIVRAQKLADGLIERYRGTDVEQFGKKASFDFLDSNPYKLPDIDSYYTKNDDLLKNPWDNPLDNTWNL